MLAFDYGTRKIGVASGQTITGTASAIAVCPVKSGQPDWAALEKLIAQWKPNAFVIGLPLNMDGTQSDSSKRARKFAAELERRFQRPVHAVDERLSTREARDLSRASAERHGKRYDARAEVDGVAAQLILESFLADY